MEMKNNTGHRIYLSCLFLSGIIIIGYVGWKGSRYYGTSQHQIDSKQADLDAKISDLTVERELTIQGISSERSLEQIDREIATIRGEEKYYSDWEPKGFIGHGLGIAGSAMMIGGVAMYSSRKRIKAMRQWGKLRYWLEFHIFLCLVGPTLVMFHTTFKIGGIVAISFWSMVAVVLSGIIGRYIYTQIPRSIGGNELSLDDLEKENASLTALLRAEPGIDDAIVDRIDHLSGTVKRGERLSIVGALSFLLKDDLARRSRLRTLRRHLLTHNIQASHVGPILLLAKQKSLLQRRIVFLDTAHRLFHYWHVVHQPFSIIMFVILIVHVVVTVALGYRWIL